MFKNRTKHSLIINRIYLPFYLKFIFWCVVQTIAHNHNPFL